MSPRQRPSEGIREARERRRARALDITYRVEVRVFGGPWIAADVCGHNAPRALEAAQARVSETWEYTDLNGMAGTLRRYHGVRLLRGREVLRVWKYGVLMGDGAPSSISVEAR